MATFAQTKRAGRLLFCVMILLAAVAKGQDFDEQRKSLRNPDGLDTGKNRGGLVTVVREKYEELPQAGKFGVTAAAGFVSSRVAFKTFVGAARAAGAAFVVSEALSISGVLEDMPPVLDDHLKKAASAKDRLLTELHKVRQGVRKSLKKDKLAAIGFATGAFIGIAV